MRDLTSCEEYLLDLADLVEEPDVVDAGGDGEVEDVRERLSVGGGRWRRACSGVASASAVVASAVASATSASVETKRRTCVSSGAASCCACASPSGRRRWRRRARENGPPPGPGERSSGGAGCGLLKGEDGPLAARMGTWPSWGLLDSSSSAQPPRRRLTSRGDGGLKTGSKCE